MNRPIISSNENIRSWLSWRIALIIGLAFLIYQPALRSGFIWDDDAYVTGNAALKSLGGLWDIWFHPFHLVQYYPMTFTSFWINYHLGGLNPFGYHAINVLLHALNSLLVWCLLERLKIPRAWFVGLFFLVHPVMVESVAWVTERKNVLSGFFYLLAFLSYLRFTDGDSGNRRWYFISYVLFLAALLSKTVTGTFPAAVLLVLWWKEGRFPWKDLIRLSPFLLSGMFLGSITMNFENYHMISMGGTEWHFTFPERFLIAGRALWFYLGKLVWPYPLIFIYSRWTIDSLSVWQWFFPLSFILLGVFLWKARPRLGRGPLFALAIFTITLLPALGFKSFFPMRFSFVADHFQYLASIPFFACAVAVAGVLLEKHARIRAGAGITALLVCGLLTWNQCLIYKDLETLWRDILSKDPKSWMAHNNLGAVLTDTGRYPEAIFHEEESIRLYSNNPEAYNNLGTLASKQNHPEKSGNYYRRALQLRPADGDVHNNLGVTLFESGKTDEAIEEYLKAIQLAPNSENAYCNLGNALLVKGKIDEAVRQYHKALELNPEYADALVNLGLALSKSGQTDPAIEYYRKALKINPDLEKTHNNLAKAFASKSFTEQARHHFLEAIRLAPDQMDFRIDYAVFLDQRGDIDGAINQYNEIIRLDPKNPTAQHNLWNLAIRDFQKTAPAPADTRKKVASKP
jgi:tetratricopeptide (TPR) repeat protein